MRLITEPDIAKAERFVWSSARLIDRLRFAHLVRGHSGDRVVAAVRLYQNADGGFGEALEPDFRGPISQPLTVESALTNLDEVGAMEREIVVAACDYLASVTTVDGGVPFALPSVTDYPHAPWWEPVPGAPASILPTGSIAGLLHKHGVEHNWLVQATEFCWRAVDRMGQGARPEVSPVQLAYDARAAATFLTHVGDPARAEPAARRLRSTLASAGVLATDVDAAAEAQGPLDYAPRPDSIARTWFDDATVDAHLDALVAAQQPDGGWTVPFPAWVPVAEHEWRGRITVDHLATLAAYGRIEPSLPLPA